MATSKVLSTTTLSIEVQSSVDKVGDSVYTRKNFANIKNNADPQNVFDKDVFETKAGGFVKKSDAKLTAKNITDYTIA